MSASASLALHADLQAKLHAIRAERAFSAADWVERKVSAFVDYMRVHKLRACVVSVSGGVDSAVTLALALRAQRAAADSPVKRVLAIAQPIHSTPSIQNRAYELCTALHAECITVDQSAVYDSLRTLVDGALKTDGSQFSRGQLRSYMRTPVNYYVAQVISQTDPCIVLGTGNKDEDGFLGYFCKAGDGVVDVQLIADLHKSEVFAVAKHLGVPDSIVVAPPSADLWPGQTDEDEMGFSYDFVELFTTMREKPEPEVAAWLDSIAPEARAYYEDKGARANAIHARNAHKFHFPVNVNVL